jgi:hypothetical protein
MVEVKTGSNLRALGAELRRLLASYDGEVALGSFDPRILLWMAHNMPDVPRIQIAGRIPEHRHPTIFKWVLRMMPLNPWTKPAAIAYDTRDLPSASLDFWSRRTGSYIIEWIVKTPEAYELATSRGHNVGFEVIRPEKRPS